MAISGSETTNSKLHRLSFRKVKYFIVYSSHDFRRLKQTAGIAEQLVQLFVDPDIISCSIFTFKLMLIGSFGTATCTVGVQAASANSNVKKPLRMMNIISSFIN